jgi:hypothetical protein
VDLTLLRNVAIVLALALVVWLVPGGSEGAGLLGQLFSAIFIAAIVVFVAQLYRRFQSDIYGLGDRMRVVLYGALATLLLTLAASGRLFATGGGAIAWFVLMGGASYALFAVWRHWRTFA